MIRRIAFLYVAALTFAAPLQAQTLGPPRPGRFGFALEAMRPQFKEDGLSGATALLSAHAELSARLRVQAELPYYFAKADDGFESISSEALGNPYIGLQFVLNPVTLNLGGRLPLASVADDEDDIYFLVGAITDLERMEAFLPDMGSLVARARLEHVSSSGIGIAAFAGSSYWVSKESDDDKFLILDYGTEISYQSRLVRTGIRVTGLYNSDADSGVTDPALHQLAGYAELARGSVRPMVQLRLPLDDELRDVSKMSVGVGVQIVLDRR